MPWNVYHRRIWHDDHMKMVHRSLEYDFDKSGQFAYHSWESLAWGWLMALDPCALSPPYLAILAILMLSMCVRCRDTIWIYGQKEEGEPGETSLTRLARRWVPGDLRNEWREAHAKGLV